MSDDYIKLRNKYKKADPTGYRRGNTDTSSIKSSQLGTNLKKNLAKLKKDLTWKPLPKVDLDNLPKKELSRDDAIGMAMDLMQTTPTGALAGVIKDKGGNWLGDSVKKALDKLKQLGVSDPRYYNDTVWAQLPEELRASVGNNYEAIPRMHPREWQAAFDKVHGGKPGYELNKWVDGPLQKYVKNRMGTPDDEIRKLADQGILHVDPEQLNFNMGVYGKYGREGQQYMAQSDPARHWEGVSDNSIGVNSPRSLVIDPVTKYGDVDLAKLPPDVFDQIVAGEVRRTFPDDAWLEKLAKHQPDANVYDLQEPHHFANDLGFDHLMDELSNALDEGSGLPQNLRLTPEGLQGLSVEEAVKKVHGINQFRAEKAKKANARFAAAEGIPVYKEYPEGYRWLEYKAGDLPKGWKEEGGRVYDPEGGYKQAMSGGDPRYAKLADWLKQEGDTMGHCVGGYCDDVISGRSRILSLRDNEGRSVATVELSPHIDYNNPDAQSWMINQIKGAGNKKPPKEAIPFIQDFVKSGHWGDVQDLEHADLIKLGAKYMSPKEALATEPYRNSLLDFNLDELTEDDAFQILRAIDEGTY